MNEQQNVERRVFRVATVTRRDAGATLWAPVDQHGIEWGITPSHDDAAMRRLCDELNNRTSLPARMTLEQFRATRRECDLRATIEGGADFMEQATPGFIYAGGLYIVLGGAHARYLLILANCEKESDDIAELEAELYEYGCDEGAI